MTTLQQLTAQGGFVSAKPIKKHISFEIDGNALEADIYIKRLGIGEYEAIYLDGDKNRGQTARAIANAVTLGPDGKERISVEDAGRLHPALAAAMLDAFNEVNGAKKASPVATDSSATSV